ncbi:hypothetical protein ACFQZC_17415 [Streptacidiphilus monticola]
MLPVVGFTGTAQAAGSSLKVAEIGRDGRAVNGSVTVVDSTGMPRYLQSGRATALPAGTYTVLADVQSAGTDTLIGKKVRVSGAGRLTLDARAGRSVRVGLDVSGQPGLDVRVCAPGGWGNGVEAWNRAGSLFVVPNADRGFTLGYLASWGGDLLGSGSSYVVSGLRGAVPAGTLGSFKRSGLAKWRVDVRGGENTTASSNVMIQPTPRQDSCQTDLIAGLGGGDGGYVTHAYVSPGTWTVRNDFSRAFTFAKPRTVAARGSYWTLFNRAVRGPASTEVPGTYWGHRLLFDADSMLADPWGTGAGGDTLTIGTYTLRQGGKVLASKRLTEWATGPSGLDVVLKSKGWYSLTADASAYAPGSRLPTGLLSTRATLSYHFYADPAKRQAAKVFATKFFPAGLDLGNQAKAGSTTALTVQAVRSTTDPMDIAVPKATVKSIRLWVSYDGGRTWHAVSLRAVGGQWTAQVRNPASGAVTLRTTVVSASGDSATETVYRAWSVR